MPYDEGSAQFIRDKLAQMQGISEKRMFGGLCFFVNGNMLCGIGKTGAHFRVGKQNQAAALAEDHARPFDLTGRIMGGMISADATIFQDDASFDRLMALAQDFACALPPKQG